MTTLTAILLMSPDKTDYKTDRFLQQRSRQRTSYILQHRCHRQWVIKQDALKTYINVPLGKFLVIFHFCLHIYVCVCVMVCVCMCLCICKQLSTWSISDVVLHFKIQLLAILHRHLISVSQLRQNVSKAFVWNFRPWKPYNIVPACCFLFLNMD
jgi:hypothetical protein